MLRPDSQFNVNKYDASRKISRKIRIDTIMYHKIADILEDVTSKKVG